MKNLIALLMVCGFAFAFVACGGKTESTEAATDSVATEAPAADTTAAPADSTAADTTAAQ
jgi:hypothetical protein